MTSFKKKPFIQKKIILNKDHHDNEFLEVAIGEIWAQDGQIYYVISFGGGKEAVFVGEEEYEKFVDLVLNLHPDPDKTWIRPYPLRHRKRAKSPFDED